MVRTIVGVVLMVLVMLVVLIEWLRATREYRVGCLCLWLIKRNQGKCSANRFPFSQIAPGGVLKRYGVLCCRCRHTNNADGTVKHTPCKKMVTIGKSGLTQEEARLRLKRWLVVGSTGRLDPERERQSHIGMGGWHLSKFDSVKPGWGEIPESDLDKMIAGMP